MLTIRSVPYLLFTLLLAGMACPPALAQEAVMPEWIKNINPIDYVLINPDSTPAFPFHIEGEINAQANVQAYGITLPDGTTQARREFLFFAQETIVADNLVKTQVKGRTLQWKLTWDVNIMVFETPEVAAAVVKDRWGDTWGVDPLTDQALGDPRLHKQGVAAANGDLVRYRNMIWYVLNRRIEEVKPPGGRDPMPMDEWNAGYGEAQSQQYYKLTQALAKTWLNKVAGPPVADLAIVGIDFDWKGLESGAVKGPPYREPRADQQWVAAQVQNQSRDLTAQNVMLQFSVQYQGEAAAEKLGDPIKVADNLAPLGIAGAAIMWDLKGKPVENATIIVECFSPNKADPTPQNNLRKEMVSIWFAQDATGRPFTWGYDTYSFINTGFEEQEVEEMVEGLLATILNNIQETPEARKVLHVALYPPTYQRLQQYFDTSMKAGVGGHCYGMAATAAVYFEDPTLKPVAKPVKDMTLAEASVNINLYHRAQMLTLLDAIVQNWDFRTLTLGTVATGSAVKQQLVAGKLCTVVEFFSAANAPPQGHAVLAYKYLEFQYGAPLVYVYDPNYPERALPVSLAMPMIRLWGNDFRCPDYMDYRTWAGGGRIGASRPFRTISLETVNQVMPSIKTMISSMVKWLSTAGKFMGLVTCPADAYFTDAAGRRVGVVGGKKVNEIPGAEIRAAGEVEIYVLPKGGQYTLTVTGTGEGTMGVSLLRATDANTIGVTSFRDLPVKAGTVFQGKVGPDGQTSALTSGGESFQPTIAGTYDVSKLPTKGTGPETGPTSSDTGNIVVCRNVEEGVPQGAADSFDQISKVYAVYEYKNVPEKTKAQVSWRRGGQEFSKGEREIGGTGWVWFSVSTTRAGGFEPGQYEVVLTLGNQVARKSFTVGGGSPAQPPTAAGEQERILNVSSLGIALNNATAPVKFTLDRTRTISRIRNYHWNNGQGKTPGTIGLRDAAGKVYGPWPATGDLGQGGVKNAYWEVLPNVTLPPGEYTVADSDPATWAQNTETGGRGMCEVWAVK